MAPDLWVADLWRVAELCPTPGSLAVSVATSCHLQTKQKSHVVYTWLRCLKDPPAMWEAWVQSLDWEDSLEKGTATLSSTLA